jgi:hypothetical protein
MALGFTQSLREMRARRGKASSARKADNLTAIYMPII